MKVLVTGGGGFLGSAIVRQLLARGDDVTIAARSNYPDVVALGATQVRGDLADPDVANAAITGQDAVIHTAAKAGIWGALADFRRSNVDATRNIVAACRAADVRTLVYTSTPSVTFDGTDHHNAVDLPYAKTFRSHYARTKCEAEQLVLNDDALNAIALRPHLIWGPGDPFIFPGVIQRHIDGKLAKVGDGTNKVDITYVENAAAAHLAALDALRTNGAAVRGRAYFISDGEPVLLWPFVAELFAALDLPPLTKRVPASVAYAAGALLEATYTLLGKTEEPRMTRFAAQQVTTSHWYDLTPARDLLGYAPVITRDEAMQRTLADLRARGLCG